YNSPVDETLVRRAPRRLDVLTLEMIVVVMLTTLHDFLLSDVLSLPLPLAPRSALAQLRLYDRLAFNLELAVPLVVFALMFGLWLAGRNAWVRRVSIVYLAWVTLRLVAKLSLVLYIILSRPQTGVGVLLRDTVVLWFVICLLFGVWYWVIDG